MTQQVSPQFPIRATFPSQTRPGVTYTVTIHEDGDALCTCPAGRHKRMCWHLTRAMADAKPRPLPLTFAEDAAMWLGVDA